jgi:hypothetical protein
MIADMTGTGIWWSSVCGPNSASKWLKFMDADMVGFCWKNLWIMIYRARESSFRLRMLFN